MTTNRFVPSLGQFPSDISERCGASASIFAPPALSRRGAVCRAEWKWLGAASFQQLSRFYASLRHVLPPAYLAQKLPGARNLTWRQFRLVANAPVIGVKSTTIKSDVPTVPCIATHSN